MEEAERVPLSCWAAQLIDFLMECLQEKVFDLCSLGGLNPAEGTLNVSYLAIFMFNDFWVLVRKPK